MPVPLYIRLRRHRLQLVLALTAIIFLLAKTFSGSIFSSYPPSTTSSTAVLIQSYQEQLDRELEHQLENQLEDAPLVSEPPSSIVDESENEKQLRDLNEHARSTKKAGQPQRPAGPVVPAVPPPLTQEDQASEIDNTDLNEINPKGKPSDSQVRMPRLENKSPTEAYEQQSDRFIVQPYAQKVARALPGTFLPNYGDFLVLDIISSGSANTRLNEGADIQPLPPASPLPRPEKFPVKNPYQLTNGPNSNIPSIQTKTFYTQTSAQQAQRNDRLATIKNAFLLSWNLYKSHAWGDDEIKPVSMAAINPFTGWGSTLIDAVDTLQIMGLTSEFRDAVNFIDTVDFAATFRTEIPMFETVIRFLGGLISAYDMSGQTEPVLLAKAIQLGDNLIGAFDTPNRMPRLHFKWQNHDFQYRELSGVQSSIAEIASMSMEFTRLAQLTNNSTYFDAIHRISESLYITAQTLRKQYLFPSNVDSSGCSIVSLSSEMIPTASLGAETQVNAAESSASSLAVAQGSLSAEIAAASASLSAGSDSPVSVTPSPTPSSSLSAGSDSPVSVTPSSTLTSSPSASLSSSTSTVIIYDTLLSSDLHYKVSTPPDGIPVTQVVATTYTQLIPQTTQYVINFSNGAEALVMEESENNDLSNLAVGPDHPAIVNNFAGKLSKRDTDTEETEDIPNYSADFRLIKGEDNPDLYGRQATSGNVRHVINVYNNGQSLVTGCESRGVYADDSSNGVHFGIGGGTDSAYEYYVKEYALLNGGNDLYKTLYENTIDASFENFMFRPLVQDDPDILFMGGLVYRGNNFYQYDNSNSHLTCFVGGMVALGSKVFNRPEDLENARKLTNGCVWSYNITASGVMPESFSVRRCPSAPLGGGPTPPCIFNASTADEISLQENQNLLSKLHAQGIDTGSWDASVQVTSDNSNDGAYDKPDSMLQISPEYALRPEALESVFYMYRITGEQEWHDKGWDMVTSILQLTGIGDSTGKVVGYSAVKDVTDNRRQGPGGTTASDLFSDSCESFWYAETLKYAYLLYSDPDVVSLDKYVFNTEAHPFMRPT